ncbi:MAG: methionine--tRNA ligase subunit beta, partial [Paludibacteraceae bacterium]|nr:methionine--tRNA ligase subunit beta [Paludibacteraceae bacterium]
GNFVNRALVLTNKYFGGKVPAKGELTADDQAVVDEFNETKKNLESLLDAFRFRDAQKEAMNLARIGNKYLADTEPWKLIKTDEARVATILNLSLQITANLAVAFGPFLPHSTEKLLGMLNLDKSVLEWKNLGRLDLLADGADLNKPELLFEKIEDEPINKQLQRLEDIKKANAEADAKKEAENFKAQPQKATIQYDDFEKLDLRVGTILECNKVPKADKLLQFKIDDGMGGRTIVSGIAQWYKPEELVGTQVIFVANLAPRKLKGIESQGMLLTSQDADGRINLLRPEVKVKSGVKIS